MERSLARSDVQPLEFRRVLSEFCTGVAVITSVHQDEPVGFTCQSFSALSLEPPLVLFCPSVRSRAWAAIEQVGHFCVNVLTHDQRAVSQVFGGRAADKFRDVAWSTSPTGMPVLAGSAAWIDCAVHQVHRAGDHFVVIGDVHSLSASAPARDRPLLFHRGEYAVTERLRLLGDEPPNLPMAVDAWF